MQAVPETSESHAAQGKHEASNAQSILPRRVALYGLFGQQNWGNDCTLQAILHNARRYLPQVEIVCICTDPQYTSRRYNIAAFPISNRFRGGYQKDSRPPANALIRLLQKLFIRIPMELGSWTEAYRILRGFDMLIVSGTGVLTDFTSAPFGIPYRILKWSIIARLCRCRLLFVSVGAGPMYHPLTRWFIKASLSLADYRSYRDAYSRDFMENIGFKTGDRDCLYPDLAFSLPKSLFTISDRRSRKETVVGVGVKDYYGKLGLPERGGIAKYRIFVDKLGRFVTWLLDRGYTVRLLMGDSLYDDGVKQDLLKLVPNAAANNGKLSIVNESLSSVEDVISSLGSTDMVVSARFHNILLALMLNKPVIALSYHDKFAALVSGVGLPEYCHDIDGLDVDALTGQVTQLEERTKHIRPHIRQKVEEYRRALDEQYARIFNVRMQPEISLGVTNEDPEKG